MGMTYIVMANMVIAYIVMAYKLWPMQEHQRDEKACAAADEQHHALRQGNRQHVSAKKHSVSTLTAVTRAATSVPRDCHVSRTLRTDQDECARHDDHPDRSNIVLPARATISCPSCLQRLSRSTRTRDTVPSRTVVSPCSSVGPAATQTHHHHPSSSLVCHQKKPCLLKCALRDEEHEHPTASKAFNSFLQKYPYEAAPEE